MESKQKQIMELLESRGTDLHRLLARLTRCEHATRDLMQELFLKLSGSRGFETASCRYAYAWKAAANLAFQWHRRRKVNAHSLDAIRFLEAPAEDSLEKLIEEEQVLRVLQVTAALRELPRNVVVMRCIEQKSYQEIADSLGKSPDYIRALCSKTLNCLRNRLGVQRIESADPEVCRE